MRKFFGIGWPKTGTTTLGECFKILGFDHQSQDSPLIKDIAKGDLSRIMALVHTKETFEDWPWILLYKELDEAFPGSRFILTKRDSEIWYRSYKNMLANNGFLSEESNQIRSIIYEVPFVDVEAQKEQLIERYERHNREVMFYFRDRPEDLLVVNWEENCGWTELCRFLGKTIPNQPFPHSNKGKYIQV